MGNGHDIPLSRPDITELEIDHVVQTLRSGRLSIGPMQEQFEALVAARAGAEHGVAVSNGTCGLHLGLLALGVGPGDEVITTPFSFVASSNAILYVGAKPVFVDINPRTLNLDPQQVEAAITPRTKAILGVEAFGNPSHMMDLANLCRKHEIPFVEDACEGFGGTHRGRPVGSFGQLAVFAFYPNKQITTGEGGMIVTNNERLADLCRSMRNQGRPVDPLEPAWQAPGSWLTHERLGYNYRLSEIHAALGVAQCKRLDEILELRNGVASKYMSRLMGMPDIILPTVDPETTMSWFVFVVRLSSEFTADHRDRILAGMRRHEVGVSNYFPPIHLQPFYMKRFGFHEGDFPITESVAQRTIALPFHTRLSEREIDLVCQTLDIMVQREKFTIDRRS